MADRNPPPDVPDVSVPEDGEEDGGSSQPDPSPEGDDQDSQSSSADDEPTSSKDSDSETTEASPTSNNQNDSDETTSTPSKTAADDNSSSSSSQRTSSSQSNTESDDDDDDQSSTVDDSSSTSDSTASSASDTSSSSSTSEASSSDDTSTVSSSTSTDDPNSTINASIGAGETSSSSDEDDGTNIPVGAIIGMAIGGVIALCLILAILGRGRYFITKFAKRSSSNDGRRHSRNSSIDSDAQMRDNHSNAPTLPDIGKASMDLAPEPLYYHSQHNRSNSSFHSRHSSRSRGLDFDMAQAPYHQSSYPPMPPAAPYRQHTFSEFGRGSGVSYAPSGSSQPWDDASSNAAGQGIPAAVPRPQPQRSSTMPISYNRPESTAWDAQPRLQIPSPRILTPSASPTIESPTMVYSPEAARASMRASVYDPFNRASVAASVYDPNMFHAH